MSQFAAFNSKLLKTIYLRVIIIYLFIYFYWLFIRELDRHYKEASFDPTCHPDCDSASVFALRRCCLHGFIFMTRDSRLVLPQLEPPACLQGSDSAAPLTFGGKFLKPASSDGGHKTPKQHTHTLNIAANICLNIIIFVICKMSELFSFVFFFFFFF